MLHKSFYNNVLSAMLLRRQKNRPAFLQILFCAAVCGSLSPVMFYRFVPHIRPLLIMPYGNTKPPARADSRKLVLPALIEKQLEAVISVLQPEKKLEISDLLLDEESPCS
jgi:hypothetical protein